jgi:NADPH-dependent 2,4-dienoyl-CoA reductase/sulfur reductase-like enzyme/ferredoxin
VSDNPFPSYLELRQTLPQRGWVAIRVVAMLVTLAICALLVARPHTGLKLWWGVAVPLLPILFFVAPGLWRSVCPLATANQAPRALRFTRGITAPAWLREHGYVVAIGLLGVLVPLRRVLFDTNGPATAALVLAALVSAFLGGLMLKGRSGWCSSICPLLPVQRVYGQTPFAMVPNSHCETCIGCTRNCYDFNPPAAYLADLYDEDPHRSASRRFFVGAFPGVVIAFFHLTDGTSVGHAYLVIGAAALASAGLFWLLETFARPTPSQLTALFGGVAINAFYWYALPRFLTTVFGSAPTAAVWACRLALVALTLVWLVRTFRKEPVYLAGAAAAESARLPTAAIGALREAAEAGEAEVTMVPDGQRLVARSGATLLEVIEQAGLPVEAGCRMGMCGADPVGVLDGADALSPVGAEERSTLERLGLGEGARMACCARVRGSCSVSLDPRSVVAAAAPEAEAEPADPSIASVVVIGNGVAGVTAADHVRRRHSSCEIHLVADEPHHLYNRMGISRLIYGRSAMQGLYLQPDAWYDEHRITCWLNTRALRIDIAERAVELGTGERLRFDRLVLATGSSGVVPRVPGFERRGAFVLRDAADAIALRAHAQEPDTREAVVLGGGLLGLEAAYALHRVGLRVCVLERADRLLRRQLDERGSDYLRRYLEGLGMEIAYEAADPVLEGDDGRVERVVLGDGRSLDCDLFLACVGISPNVDLARAAGLVVASGVVVDDGMRTSAAGVFAAGDVAEHGSRIWGLWPTAVEQATVAAANVLGGDERFAGFVPVTMLKVSGIDLTSIGRFEPAEGDLETIVLEEVDEHRYRKLVIGPEGTIAGAILLGFPREAPLVSAAAKEGRDVRPLLEELRAGSWEALEHDG